MPESTKQNDNPWASDAGQEAIKVMGWPANMGIDSEECSQFVIYAWELHGLHICHEPATAILNQQAIEWLWDKYGSLELGVIRAGATKRAFICSASIHEPLLGAGDSLAEALIQAVLKGGTDANATE